MDIEGLLEENNIDNDKKQEIFINKYFPEDLTIAILEFLLDRVMILNCSSLLNIRFNPETYFNENLNAHSEFDLRVFPNISHIL